MAAPPLFTSPLSPGPHHYCPDCEADSLYAPQASDMYHRYHYQAYVCGAVVHYRPDWSVPFRWPCRTFGVWSPGRRYSGLKMHDAITADEPSFLLLTPLGKRE